MILKYLFSNLLITLLRFYLFMTFILSYVIESKKLEQWYTIFFFCRNIKFFYKKQICMRIRKTKESSIHFSMNLCK